VRTIVIDVRLYSGARIEQPLPPGATWHHASEAVHRLRSDYSDVVALAWIRQPASTPVLERLDRTLVGAW
jgi:hypothetical protein